MREHTSDSWQESETNMPMMVCSMLPPVCDAFTSYIIVKSRSQNQKNDTILNITFRDIGGEKGSYLDKPCQKENEGYEVEVGAPARKTVNSSVHEEHPTFLRCSLVHSKDAAAFTVRRRKEYRFYNINTYTGIRCIT